MSVLCAFSDEFLKEATKAYANLSCGRQHTCFSRTAREVVEYLGLFDHEGLDGYVHVSPVPSEAEKIESFLSHFAPERLVEGERLAEWLSRESSRNVYC